MAAVAAIGSGWIAASAALAVPERAQAEVYQGKLDCGGSDTSGVVVGSVSFSRTGDTLTIRFHLRGASPNTTYSPRLYDNDNPCELVDIGADFTTNSHGSARGSLGDEPVPGLSQFFMDFQGNEHNQTTTVTLP